MSKFCGKCGAQLDDQATFCTNCGTPCAPTAQPQGAPKSAPINMAMIKDAVSVESIKNIKNKPNKLTIAILGIAAALVIALIIILCNIIFGSNYKTPINNIEKVYNNMDISAYKKLLPETKLLTYTDATLTSRAQSLRNSMISTYGADAKMTVKVISKTDLSSSLSSIYSLATSYADIKDIYTVNCEVTRSGSTKTLTKNMSFVVGKVSGKWCLLDDGVLSVLNVY